MDNKEQQRLNELWSEVYTAEDMIDSVYSVNMYKNKYPEVDKKHKEVLKVLNEYCKLLEQYKL